jgi:hypothetical protein
MELIIGPIFLKETDMDMWVTEADWRLVFQNAVAATARKLRIPEVEFKSIAELLTEIERADKTTHGVLVAFLTAWREWFSFHLKIAQEDRELLLSDSERNELQARVIGKENTRSALVSRLQGLG